MAGCIRYENNVKGVDWLSLKGQLEADDFDNGRTAEELQRSFASSFAVVIAWASDRIVGTARVLADGVCNA